LNSPKQARALRVRLIKEKTEGSGKHRHTHYITLSEMVLGKEKEYVNREYEFELKTPILPKKPPAPSGLLGTISNFLFAPRARIRYYIDASLDIAMSFDINKKQDVLLVNELGENVTWW
ncbi:MAG: hypothetical protein ABIH99_04345, partial [Candidatus Micrarchaeota archaeon]